MDSELDILRGDSDEDSIFLEQKFKEIMENVRKKKNKPRKELFEKRLSTHRLRPSMIDRAILQSGTHMATSTPMPTNRKLSFTSEKEAVSPINVDPTSQQKKMTENNKPESVIILSSNSHLAVPITPPSEQIVNNRTLLNKSVPNIRLKKSILEQHVQRLSKSAEKNHSNKLVQASIPNTTLNWRKKLARNSVNAVVNNRETETQSSYDWDWLADSCSSNGSSVMSSFLRNREEDNILFAEELKLMQKIEQPTEPSFKVGEPWRAPHGLKTFISEINTDCISDVDLSVDEDDTFRPKPPLKRKVFANKKKKHQNDINSVKTCKRADDDSDDAIGETKKKTPARKSRIIVDDDALEEVPSVEKRINVEKYLPREETETYDINLNRQSTKEGFDEDDPTTTAEFQGSSKHFSKLFYRVRSLKSKKFKSLKNIVTNLNQVSAVVPSNCRRSRNEENNAVGETCYKSDLATSGKNAKTCKNCKDSVSQHKESPNNSNKNNVINGRLKESMIIPLQEMKVVTNERNHSNTSRTWGNSERIEQLVEAENRGKSPRKLQITNRSYTLDDETTSGKLIREQIDTMEPLTSILQQKGEIETRGNSPRKLKSAIEIREYSKQQETTKRARGKPRKNCEEYGVLEQLAEVKNIEKSPKKLKIIYKSYTLDGRLEVPQPATNETTLTKPAKENIDITEPLTCIDHQKGEIETTRNSPWKWKSAIEKGEESNLVSPQETIKRKLGRPRKNCDKNGAIKSAVEVGNIQKSPKKSEIAGTSYVDNNRFEELADISDVLIRKEKKRACILHQELEVPIGRNSAKKLNSVAIERTEEANRRARGRPRKKAKNNDTTKQRGCVSQQEVEAREEDSVFVYPPPVDKRIRSELRETRYKSVLNEEVNTPINEIQEEPYFGCLSPTDTKSCRATAKSMIQPRGSSPPSESITWNKSRKNSVNEIQQQSVVSQTATDSGTFKKLKVAEKSQDSCEDTVQQPKKKLILDGDQSKKKRQKLVNQTYEQSINEGSSGFAKNTTLRRSMRERRPAVSWGRIVLIKKSEEECRRLFKRNSKSSISRRTSTSSVRTMTFRENGRTISSIAEVTDETNDNDDPQTSKEKVSKKKEKTKSGKVTKRVNKKSKSKVETLDQIINVSENLNTDNEASTKPRRVNQVLDIFDIAPVRNRDVHSPNPEDDLEMVDGVGVIITLNNLKGLSSGFLKMAPGKCKLKQMTKKHEMIFIVQEGKAQVEIGNNKKVYSVRQTFSVPKGSNYIIRNMDKKDNLLLFFTRVCS